LRSTPPNAKHERQQNVRILKQLGITPLINLQPGAPVNLETLTSYLGVL
jgi:hypothetical protein